METADKCHGASRLAIRRRQDVQSAVIAGAENTVAATTDGRAGKYLVFQLGREEFGIGVLKVREIMGVQDITAVPQTPAHVKGVINLRGKVIPVVDLRLKFGLPEIEYTQRTCIIVVQLHAGANSMLMGIVVDGVAEVLNLAAGDIEDTPDFGQGLATTYLLGMAKIKGKVKILLDIDDVLSSQQFHGLETILQQTR
jgi:purine-binding chemotaxis protein CheW